MVACHCYGSLGYEALTRIIYFQEIKKAAGCQGKVKNQHLNGVYAQNKLALAEHLKLVVFSYIRCS